MSLLLSLNSSLYILDDSPLSDMFFTNIFFKCVACLFTILTISFTKERMFFILMTFSLSFLSFMDHIVGVFKNHSQTQVHLNSSCYVLLLLLLMLLSCFSRVRLCATPQTAAHQAPPSLGFSRRVLEWGAIAFS